MVNAQLRNLSRWSALAMLLVARVACAPDLAGDWQGDLVDGARQLRVVCRIAKADGGTWAATIYSIDQSSDSIPVNSVTLTQTDFTLRVDALHFTYQGKLSQDATLIKGTATRYNRSFPMEWRRATRETAYPFTPVNHQVQFIRVDTNVNLEVLDWGGSGRPLILLAGFGDTAHRFDTFAPKLAAAYHVFGITRRGFGESSHPDAGYSADRLGDDVLAVIDSLKLDRPVLVGHSFAGEELSSVGSRYPERVAGLIYLEAGYPYAYYDRSHGDLILDVADVLRKLQRLLPVPPSTREAAPQIRELVETDLPQVERELRDLQTQLDAVAPATTPSPPPSPGVLSNPVFRAMIAGQQKYTKIDVPILAIYALPHGDSTPQGPDQAATRAAQAAAEEATTGAQARAFEAGLPSARVVRIPYASHYIFQSHEADVLREIKAFLSSLARLP
jgi:non-heme chloroperoxidase